MADINDLLQVTIESELQAQQMLNVYYYRVLEGYSLNDEITGGEVLDELIAQLITPVRAFQHEDVDYRSIEVRNLSNGIEFVERPLAVSGQITGGGDCLPAFVTVAFSLIRSTLLTRNGRKSYSGIPEAAVDGFSVNLGGTAETDTADGLKAIIVQGGTPTLRPVIVKRPIPASPFDQYVYSFVSDALFLGLGTQNTRKQGRGS